MNEIYISKPYITNSGKGLYRLCADISIDEISKTVFVEVEEVYKDYLLHERSDAFVFLTLPIAIRLGYNIISETPVTDIFLHNLNTMLIPPLVKGDPNAKPIQIIAPNVAGNIGLFRGIGTAPSGGVDSTYTIMKYTSNDLEYKNMKLTHLIIASVSYDLWDFSESDDLYSWEKKHKEKFDRYYKVSQYTGLPLVKVFTNFVRYVSNIISPIDESYRHSCAHISITMSVILALKKLFSIYYFSSTFEISEFSVENHLSKYQSHYELLLMNVLNTSEFMCIAGGGTVDRIDKTYELSSYPLAQKMLHPCFKDGKMNCSEPTCSKCLRALLTLDHFNKLDNMSEMFDVERYRKNRREYLKSLAKRKDKSLFQTLYNLFMEKHPEDMKIANMELEPVSRNAYNNLLSAYNSTLTFLNESMSKEKIVDFFETRKVKKLFFIGHSKFGKIILQALRGKILIEHSADEIQECDAIFISAVNDMTIKKIRNNLSAAGMIKEEKMIFTINDIMEELLKK